MVHSEGPWLPTRASSFKWHVEGASRGSSHAFHPSHTPPPFRFFIFMLT